MSPMNANKKKSILHSRAFVPFVASAFFCVVMPLLTGCDNISPKQAQELMSNPDRPDARREGVAAIVTRWSWGKLPRYPQIYQQIAQHDSDVTVRAMAIRALNICRDQSATKIFIAGLQDQNEQIRLESAKALANVPDPDAIGVLIDVLTGSRETMTTDGHRTMVPESKDVRIAAADALRQYRKLDVARTLVGYLNEQDFSVAWQSRQSLIALTGQDLQYDQSAWLQYLIGPSKPFG
jgi:HEAT repeats